MAVISLSKREQVVSLANDGFSQRHIARELKISRCAVQNILKKNRIFSNIRNQNKGRKPKMNIRAQRKLIIMSKQNPTLTANEIRREAGVRNDVSVDTVKRILRSANLFGRIATKKPFFNKRIKRLRREWCKEKHNWNVIDWQKVIYLSLIHI